MWITQGMTVAMWERTDKFFLLSHSASSMSDKLLWSWGCRFHLRIALTWLYSELIKLTVDSTYYCQRGFNSNNINTAVIYKVSYVFSCLHTVRLRTSSILRKRGTCLETDKSCSKINTLYIQCSHLYMSI
jgi:hypothetical protein